MVIIGNTKLDYIVHVVLHHYTAHKSMDPRNAYHFNIVGYGFVIPNI